jgi:hypothetical protein
VRGGPARGGRTRGTAGLRNGIEYVYETAAEEVRPDGLLEKVMVLMLKHQAHTDEDVVGAEGR